MATKGQFKKEHALYIARRGIGNHISDSNRQAWAKEIGGIYPIREPKKFSDYQDNYKRPKACYLCKSRKGYNTNPFTHRRTCRNCGNEAM